MTIIYTNFLGSKTLCSVTDTGTNTGTELNGNSEICPGISGVFECKTTNTEVLLWRVVTTSLLFPGHHRP